MRRRLWPWPLLAAPLLGACAGGLPEAATEQGREIRDLWTVFFWAAVGVAALVYGLILWSVVRYRSRGDGLPPQSRSNIPIEVVYTVVPILVVAGLFALTFLTEREVEDVAPDPAAVVRVEAFDWSWRFDYAGTPVSVFGTPEDPPELVLPSGETVRFVLTSSDVIHSFFVRDFLFKRDAIPGRVTEFDLTVEEPGTYAGQCAEFCGLDHARMRFTIRAVPRAEFDAWLAAAEDAA